MLTAANPAYPEILLCRKITAALWTALEKISAEGKIVPVSGYRSKEEQTQIYSDSRKGATFISF